MSGQVLGIVPARLASTRLPRKPLYPLLGRPLIEWVWRRVEEMSVLDHGGPKAQIYVEGLDAPLFFAQVRDAMAFLKSPERDRRVRMSYVSDMGVAENWDTPGIDNWTPAPEAHFVIEAGVRGGMGAPEVVPFARREDAEAFATRYGGRIVTLDDIPDEAVLGAVDPEADLQEPSG